MISFGVPFLANPDLPERFAKGAALNAPDPATFYGGEQVIERAAAVRGLRDVLVPSGWLRSNEGNYSVVVNPVGTMAIAVATGDDATGLADRSPTTKARKGPSTLYAVSSNQLQLGLFPGDESPLPSAVSVGSATDCMTWILLVHRTRGEVRCELSLPSSMGDGYIEAWHERILLTPVPIDSEVSVNVPDQPDIAIEIKRKA